MSKWEDMGNHLTVHQMIEEYAEKEPAHVAIRDEDTSPLRYRELNQKANQLAHYLQKFKLQPDTLIAISLDRSSQLLIGILGILKAGCAYLPLDADHPKNRLQYILKDTRTPILITQSKSKHKFNNYPGQIILIDQDWHKIKSQPSHNPTCPINPENLAYVIYTSGSTGKPKGVLTTHQSVINYIKWFSDYSACREQERIDFSSNVIFDMAVTTTITALALGLQIVICSDEVKKNIHQYLFYLQTNKINLIKLTPSYFKILIEEAKNHVLELTGLHTIILGGEILYAKDCLAWLEMFPKHVLFNEYGPTETTVAVTTFKVTKENISKLELVVPIGKPGFNIDCKLMNDDMQITPLGETGELYVGGKCLARGYLNQEELTSKQFINDPFQSGSLAKLYKTGDLCRYLSDGNIEFIKRIDDQVKIRGYRIEQGEIEACLASHPMIKECCVITRDASYGEKQLIGYYILNDENQAPSNNGLRKYLQERLPDYMIPASFVKVKLFPLNENGKLDKNALPEPSCTDEVIAPRNRLENQLIGIWQKEFRRQKIGVKSNFFELGGHSLIATRIIIEIEKSIGKKIRLEDLYKAPTISELTSIIATAKKSAKKKVKPSVILNSNVVPLSDFQFMFWISNIFEPKVKKLNIMARRRISGKLDNVALTFALKWVSERHEILSYRIGKFFPAQCPKKEIKFQIIEKDLTTLSDNETETSLSNSLDELISHSTWQKNLPLIIVKLFHLKNEISELQICVPHIVFDDASEEVLFEELSTAYLHYENGSRFIPHNELTQYKEYVIQERDHFKKSLKRNIIFWEQYLNDADILTFPETEIIHNMENIPYSTYLELPDKLIENTHQHCINASVSITDYICSAIALALERVAGPRNNKIFMNVIRSVRDNKAHDNIIGCFLRLDPVKIDVNSNLNLTELAKNVQQSRIDTESYQTCSGMLKLACLGKKTRKDFIIYLLSAIYSKLFYKLKLNPTLLMMYGRLKSIRTKRQFIININLLNNFVSPKQDKNLFGFRLEKTKTHKHDILNINNVLDICLLKDESLDKAYLVISGNLKESFRQHIGNEILNELHKS